MKYKWLFWLPMLALVIAGCEFPNGFHLILPNPAVTLARGATQNVVVEVGVINYNTFPASLTLSGLPSGVSAQFNPTRLTAGESALTLTASSTATLGLADVTITGQSQTKTNAVKLQLNVTNSATSTRESEDNVPRVFARSGSNELLYFDLNGWRSLGGQIKGVPAAVSWGGSRIDVFACGMDNAVWHICSDDSVIWSAWESLGNSIAAPNTDPRRLQREFSPAISVVSTGSNTLRIVVRGAHGGVSQKNWMRDHWSPAVGEWEQLGDIVALAGPVAITKPLRIGGYGTTIAIRDKSRAVQLFS